MTKRRIKHINVHIWDTKVLDVLKHLDNQDELIIKIEEVIADVTKKGKLTDSVTKWIVEGILRDYLNINNQIDTKKLAKELMEEIKRENILVTLKNNVNKEKTEEKEEQIKNLLEIKEY